jgi:hypothetical protein
MRHQDEWKVVHEVKGEGHVVRVQRRGDERPQYSFQIGRERRQIEGEAVDERLLPFVQLRFNAGVLDRESLSLVERALEWVESDARTFNATSAVRHDRERANWNGSMPLAEVGRRRDGGRDRDKRKKYD